MEVKRYIYQSPYNAPVQFGRPDYASQQSEQNSLEIGKNGNETLKKAQVVKNQLQNEAGGGVQESVKTFAAPRVLDIYA